MYHVSYIMYHVPCIIYHISCIMYHISYIMYHVSYLIYQNMNDIRYTFQALKACQDAKKEADQKALWRVG